MSNKRFASVGEMMNEISDDLSFNDEFAERLTSRMVITSLIAMRTAKGISQSDIAEELECSQGRISKLEQGVDDKLSLRDINAYSKVLGLEMHILCSKRGDALAAQVKYHALQIRSALRKLVELANTDREIVNGVAKLHLEAVTNFMRFIQETSSKLPPNPDSGRPYIEISSFEVEEETEADKADELNSGSPTTRGTVPFEPALP